MTQTTVAAIYALVWGRKAEKQGISQKRVYKPMNAHYIEYEQLKQKYRKQGVRT